MFHNLYHKKQNSVSFLREIPTQLQTQEANSSTQEQDYSEVYNNQPLQATFDTNNPTGNLTQGHEIGIIGNTIYDNNAQAADFVIPTTAQPNQNITYNTDPNIRITDRDSFVENNVVGFKRISQTDRQPETDEAQQGGEGNTETTELPEITAEEMENLKKSILAVYRGLPANSPDKVKLGTLFTELSMYETLGENGRDQIRKIQAEFNQAYPVQGPQLPETNADTPAETNPELPSVPEPTLPTAETLPQYLPVTAKNLRNNVFSINGLTALELTNPDTGESKTIQILDNDPDVSAAYLNNTPDFTGFQIVNQNQTTEETTTQTEGQGSKISAQTETPDTGNRETSSNSVKINAQAAATYEIPTTTEQITTESSKEKLREIYNQLDLRNQTGTPLEVEMMNLWNDLQYGSPDQDRLNQINQRLDQIEEGRFLW